MERTLSMLSFLVPLALYLKTLCPQVFSEYSGELITAVHKLGIPHPTGFPLYCILGKLFTSATVLQGSVAYRLNLLSALSMALCGHLLYRIARRAYVPWAAFGVTLLATVSFTPWSQATHARVYPLTLAFLLGELLLALELLERPWVKRYFLLCFLTGLSLATHSLALIFLPVLLLVSLAFRRNTILSGGFFLLVGLALYLYLPLRSHHQSPYLVEGRVDTVERFVSYMTHGTYRDKQFSRSFLNVTWFFSLILENVARQLTPMAYLLLIPGIPFLFRTQGTMARILILMGILNVFVLLGYGDNRGIFLIDRYFVFLDFIVALAMGAGLASFLTHQEPLRRKLGALFLVLAPSLSLMTNWSQCDLSGSLSSYFYGKTMMDLVEPDGNLLLAGDTPLFLADYLRYCENYRPDVKVKQNESAPAILKAMAQSDKLFRIYMNFVPTEIPQGYRLKHHGLLWLLAPEGDDSVAPVDFRQFPTWAFTSDPGYSDYKTADLGGDYFFHMALDQLEKGDPLAAEKSLETAHDLTERHHLIRYSLAQVYLRELSRPEKALALVSEGFSSDLDAQEDPLQRARVYTRVGLYPQALEELSPLLAGGSLKALALKEAYRIHLRMGTRQEAEKLRVEALKLDPTLTFEP